MKKVYYLFIYPFLFVVSDTYAQGIGLDSSKIPGGVKISSNPGDDLAKVIRNSIDILFAIGAMAFIIMIIWGAVSWILSGGDKEKVSNARKRITTSIVGLVLLSLSFVIIVVLGQILNIEFLQSGNFRIPTLYKP